MGANRIDMWVLLLLVHAPQEQQQALSKARQETEDSIQKHNHKYNAMLAERMKSEDILTERLAEVEAELATRRSLHSDLEGHVAELQAKWRTDESRMQETAKVRIRFLTFTGTLQALLQYVTSGEPTRDA